jgi:hypothetical protein
MATMVPGKTIFQPTKAGAAKKSVTESSRNIARRWTPKLIEGGWTPISTFFLDNYHRLEPSLSSLEAMLVIHLMRHKWDERHPHPTFATLARRMGVTTTATRNHARSLEKKRFLNRIITHGQPNQFDLTPMLDALERLYLANEETKKVKATKHGDEGVVEEGEPIAMVVVDETLTAAVEKLGRLATDSEDGIPFTSPPTIASHKGQT